PSPMLLISIPELRPAYSRANSRTASSAISGDEPEISASSLGARVLPAAKRAASITALALQSINQIYLKDGLFPRDLSFGQRLAVVELLRIVFKHKETT